MSGPEINRGFACTLVVASLATFAMRDAWLMTDDAAAPDRLTGCSAAIDHYRPSSLARDEFVASVEAEGKRKTIVAYLADRMRITCQETTGGRVALDEEFCAETDGHMIYRRTASRHAAQRTNATDHAGASGQYYVVKDAACAENNPVISQSDNLLPSKNEDSTLFTLRVTL